MGKRLKVFWDGLGAIENFGRGSGHVLQRPEATD